MGLTFNSVDATVWVGLVQPVEGLRATTGRPPRQRGFFQQAAFRLGLQPQLFRGLQPASLHIL